jgi:hypothetical protein
MNTRKRILYSSTIILCWLGFVGKGTYALFNDTASLASNNISTGTASLLISNSQSASSTTYEDTRPGFSFTLSPGQTDEKFFLLKNTSQADIDFDIDATAVITSTADMKELPQNTTIEFIPVDEQGVATGQSASATLYNYSNGHIPIPVTVAKGGTARLKMRVGVNQNYGVQGVSATYDLIFTGNQKPSGV